MHQAVHTSSRKTFETMYKSILFRLFPSFLKPCLLLILTMGIFFASFMVPQYQATALAANPGSGHICSWYTVYPGDTLGILANRYRSTIWALAHANYIPNINLIFVGQRLCIPRPNRSSSSWQPRGIFRNGTVRWYAYDALEWSNHAQINGQIHQIAALYGLPANLMLAIAWQESGWQQHVISRDGGIGVMQVMPYTAVWINSITNKRFDPYKLWDNLTISATYLRWLWQEFGGNWAQIISAYNEGAYAVSHWGIYDWSYVNSVFSLARHFY